MNILILNWKDIKHPQMGGAEIVVYKFAKRLVRDGHKVTWFTRSYIGGKRKDTIDGVKIIRKGNLLTEYLYAPIYYWSLKIKPDLVIDMSNTIYWQTPIWAFRSKRIAYLNQLGMQVFDYEYNLPLAEIGKIIERIQYIPYVRMPFICYSNSTKEDLIKMGVSKNNIKVFSLGLDHDRYIPGKKSKSPLFICVNRLVRMKRTYLAVESMKLVVKKYPNAKLVIIGSGYEKKNLEELRNRLKLQKSVIFQSEAAWFFKKNAQDAKIELMQQAWALIFPSVKEGWGMTVTECGACGTTTIASDVSGLRDSVVDGKTGLLVSKNPTSKEIAKEMINLVSNKKLRERLSKNAFYRAKEFTWEKSYRSFKKIITRMV